MNLIKKTLPLIIALHLLLPTQAFGMEQTSTQTKIKKFVKDHQVPLTHGAKIAAACVVAYVMVNTSLYNIDKADRIIYDSLDNLPQREKCTAQIISKYASFVIGSLSTSVIAIIYALKHTYHLGKYFYRSKPKPAPEQALQAK